MTRRPASIRRVVDIGFGRDRDLLALRETEEYGELYRELWHELWSEIRASPTTIVVTAYETLVGRGATRPNACTQTRAMVRLWDPGLGEGRGMSGGRSRRREVFVLTSQIGIVAALLLIWEYGPTIPVVSIRSSSWTRSSSAHTTRVAKMLWILATGAQGATQIWGPFMVTITTALIGTISAMTIGAICRHRSQQLGDACEHQGPSWSL